MLIGELAERTGASRRCLRYYEQNGLLHSSRGSNGWRHYGDDAVTRVRNVRYLLSAGLTVRDIQRVTECLDMPDILACDAPEDTVGMYEERLRELDTRLAALQQHRDELAGRIRHLRGRTGYGGEQ